MHVSERLYYYLYKEIDAKVARSNVTKHFIGFSRAFPEALGGSAGADPCGPGGGGEGAGHAKLVLLQRPFTDNCAFTGSVASVVMQFVAAGGTVYCPSFRRGAITARVAIVVVSRQIVF